MIDEYNISVVESNNSIVVFSFRIIAAFNKVNDTCILTSMIELNDLLLVIVILDSMNANTVSPLYKNDKVNLL